MREFSKVLPDQEVGLRLEGDDVERLRLAVAWARQRRGLSLKEIARACDVPEHTLRNFVHRKSLRPANALLGRLYRYFSSRRGLSQGATGADDFGPEETESAARIGILARYGLVRLEVPITEDDIRRVYDRYCGYYMCFSRTVRPAEYMASWLHVRPQRAGASVHKDDLPLARFTLLIVLPGTVEPGTTRRYVIPGYVMSRNGRLFFTGHYDGELQYMTLNEPPSRRFDYLEGVALLTASAGRGLISSRVVCQHLGTAVERASWHDRIGVFEESRLRQTFDNATAIVNALGTGHTAIA